VSSSKPASDGRLWLLLACVAPWIAACVAFPFGGDLPIGEADWLAAASTLALAQDIAGDQAVRLVLLFGTAWASIAGAVVWRVLPVGAAWMACLWSLAASPMTSLMGSTSFWLPLPVLGDVLWRAPAMSLLPMLLWPSRMSVFLERAMIFLAALTSPPLALLAGVRLAVEKGWSAFWLLFAGIAGGVCAVAAGISVLSIQSGPMGQMLLIALASLLLMMLLLAQGGISLVRAMGVFICTFLATPFSWLPLVALALYGLRASSGRPVLVSVGLLPVLLAAAGTPLVFVGTAYVLWRAPAKEVRLDRPTPNAFFFSHLPFGFMALDEGRVFVSLGLLPSEQIPWVGRERVRLPLQEPDVSPTVPSLREVLQETDRLAGVYGQIEVALMSRHDGAVRTASGGRALFRARPSWSAPILALPSCQRHHAERVCGEAALAARAARLAQEGYVEIEHGVTFSVWRKEN
jgi:hypothetical protein